MSTPTERARLARLTDWERAFVTMHASGGPSMVLQELGGRARSRSDPDDRSYPELRTAKDVAAVLAAIRIKLERSGPDDDAAPATTGAAARTGSVPEPAPDPPALERIQASLDALAARLDDLEGLWRERGRAEAAQAALDGEQRAEDDDLLRDALRRVEALHGRVGDLEATTEGVPDALLDVSVGQVVTALAAIGRGEQVALAGLAGAS